MAVEVSQKYREVIYSGGAINRATLTINDQEIPNSNIKKITISSPIIDNTVDYFYIGTFIAQKVEIEFRNADSIDLSGTVSLVIGTKTDDEQYAGEDGYEDVTIGEFIINTSPEEYSQSATITCYDKSILFKPNVDIREFFDDDGKVTAENLLKGLCNKFLGSNMLGTYPNTNKDVTTNLYDTDQSGKYYISKIAEIMGCNAKIGRDGKLYLLPVKRPSTVTIDALKSKSWTFSSEYHISKVFWQVGNTIYSAGDDTYNSLNISTDNVFIYGQDNDTQDIIDNLYEELDGFEVCSIETENYGDPSLDCWDLLTFTLGEESCVALNDNTLVYEMNMSTTIAPNIPSKQQEDVTNVLSGNKRETNIMKTEIKWNEREIALLADKVVPVSNTIYGTGSIQLEDAYEGQLYKLKIKGNISLLFPQSSTEYGYALVPSDTLTPSNTLVPSNPMPYGNEVYYPNNELFTKSQSLIVDDVEYKLDFDFLNYYSASVYDEFVYDNGTCYIIRRVGVDSNGDLYATDEEIIEPRKSVIINIKPNSTISLKSFPTAMLTATYLLQNDYTDNFATEVYVNSEITQTADAINLEVSKKVGEDEIISKINQTPETITINANRVNLNGYVTVTDLSGSGTTTINGSNITTGEIKSSNYIADTSGTKIALNDGTIDTKNFKLSNTGNMTCSSATLTDGILKLGNNEIFNASGVLSSIIVAGVVTTPEFVFSGDFSPLGSQWDGTNQYSKDHISFSFDIPSDFTVLSAYIYLKHEPCINDTGGTPITGYCKNLELYKGTISSSSKKYINWVGGYIGNTNANYTKITNAWRNSGTAFTGSSSSVTEDTTIDLKNYISTGINHLAIMSSNGSTTINYSDIGAVLAQLFIIGYTKI